MQSAPFLVDTLGEFTAGQVRIVWTGHARPPYPDLDALIARTWADRAEAARQNGTMLYNGSLVRCLSWHHADDTLTIEAGPTNYADFLGTNAGHPDRGDEFGWEFFSNPIGTSTTVVTSDGWLLLGRRNDRVASHPGYVHNFGGAIEADDRRDDNSYDAFEAVLRELAEEIGVQSRSVHQIICLGLIRDPMMRQPELIFDSHLSLTREEIETVFDPEAEGQEHAAIVTCPDTPKGIALFARSTRPIAPVALGAICLHGRRMFGEAWYQDLLQTLTD